jgi:NAD-dependent dihydropyrimidine dehydrogenase PreA subunit
VGCGACLQMCPAGVFAASGGGVTAQSPDACRLCGRCTQVRRPGAITLNGQTKAGGAAPATSTPARGVRSGRLFKARTPAGLLPAGVLACVLGSSRAGYFTLNGRHFVLAAVCRALLAIVARMR